MKSNEISKGVSFKRMKTNMGINAQPPAEEVPPLDHLKVIGDQKPQFTIADRERQRRISLRRDLNQDLEIN